MIQIDYAKVSYGKQVALDINEPLTIEEGDRIGIIGNNGAGKSTLINVLLGLAPGEKRIHMDLKPEEIAVQLQQNRYSEVVSVRCLIETFTRASIKKDARLNELIDFFELRDSLKKKHKELSGGQKQRVTLVMVLYANAKLVILDEVTSGLDFETRTRLISLLEHWYAKQDSSLLMVSHYYDELDRLANKILLLEKGHPICYGSIDELFRRYCGNRVILLDKTEKAEALFKGHQRILCKSDQIALSCENNTDETALTRILIENGMDYMVRSRDIELMSINAIAQHEGRI